MTVFLSTLSLRRATHRICLPLRENQHFYPRSPCGERRQLLQASGRNLYFYPRSPCGERPNSHHTGSRAAPISIHALLAESDCNSYFHSFSSCNISIHALLAESDDGRYGTSTGVLKFLSTLSLRRATNAAIPIHEICQISIHALLAESDEYHKQTSANVAPISIHALLAESDLSRCDSVLHENQFLSTLSLRRAT